MKINIIAFFTLILLTCNAFGMEEQPSQGHFVHLAVNKSGTLLCSISYEQDTNTDVLNIWRIVDKNPRATSLLKMKGAKSFLQSLPQELVAELQNFTQGYAPREIVKIQSIPIGCPHMCPEKAEFDSDDNLYFLNYNGTDSIGTLQIWQKEETHGKIHYSLIYNLPKQWSFFLNSNTLIADAILSTNIYNITKQTDENSIALEVAQTIPNDHGSTSKLSDDSFFLSDVPGVKVYKKEKGDAFYTLIKQVDTDDMIVLKGPNESIITIIDRRDKTQPIDGKVWLKENYSSDKPSYEFRLNGYLDIVAVDDLGRLYCKTPQNTIDILHNIDPNNPQNYQRIAQLPYFALKTGWSIKNGFKLYRHAFYWSGC